MNVISRLAGVASYLSYGVALLFAVVGCIYFASAVSGQPILSAMPGHSLWQAAFMLWLLAVIMWFVGWVARWIANRRTV